MSYVAERTTLAFAAPAATLAALVALFGKVVERRNTVPILSNLLIEATADGGLAITGTDLDVWATARAPEGAAQVTTAGSATLPAQLLGDILRKLPKDELVRVEIAEGETQAKIRAGRSVFRLQYLPAGDFPEMKTINDETVRFGMTPSTLTRIVEEVGFAVSTEETRYYLNGVCLHGEGESGDALVAVATDGHRLSRLALAVEGDVAHLDRIIVPRKTVSLFTMLAGTADDTQTVRLATDGQILTLETERLRLVSRLIDGKFPDYDRVIPHANTLRARLDRKGLHEAVDRVATISAERGRGVAFEFDEGELGLLVRTPDAGEARDAVPIEGEAFTMMIGFNARYVADALATFPDGPVEFALADPGSPALLRIPGDETHLVVLMPMRI